MERKVERVQFPNAQKIKLLRTAAYARVSSGKDAMLHSLSAQVSYYNSLIQSNPEWLFCGVYADEALTGTKENREQFQKLLSECRAGNIDLIITKSISRFARNTVILLETVRELKELGVDVYFEEQYIHSISPDGELMLTILSSYAQEESYSVSENQKWRIRNDFRQGKVSTVIMLGYKRNRVGKLVVIPKEAEIVRLIFSEALKGSGGQSIANMLNEQKIRTKNGCEWTAEGVRRILTNEKYCGDLLLQKFYNENHLTKRKRKNNGECPQVHVEDAHPAIIDKETFLRVQEIMQEHQRFTAQKDTHGVYPFTGMIKCGCCGKSYRRKTTATGIVWICSTYNRKGKKYCPTAKQIPEEKLIAACCEVLGISVFDETLLKSAISQIIIPKPNHIRFQFSDGSERTIIWQDRSRSESWTAEMRAATGQQTRERSKKWRKLQLFRRS